MGSGRWDSTLYDSTRKARRAAGVDDFDFSRVTMAKPASARVISPLLDPKKIKGVRECRDSDDHPLSKGVALFFDQTGSMRELPYLFQEKLEKLMTLIQVKSGLLDVQMLFGAIGDANNHEQFPFQVGQFEADNRCDEQLRQIILEGQGGGSSEESYDLAYYFAGRMVALDSLEKRGQKGYLFTLGDERYYPQLTAKVVKTVFGHDTQGTLAFPDLLAAAQRNFECFHLHCQEGSYRDDSRVTGPWRDLLGQRLVMLEKADEVCEVVAGIVAGCEGIDLSTLSEYLGTTVNSVETAVEAYRANTPAKVDLIGSLPTPAGAGATRA